MLTTGYDETVSALQAEFADCADLTLRQMQVHESLIGSDPGIRI